MYERADVERMSATGRELRAYDARRRAYEAELRAAARVACDAAGYGPRYYGRAYRAALDAARWTTAGSRRAAAYAAARATRDTLAEATCGAGANAARAARAVADARFR